MPYGSLSVTHALDPDARSPKGRRLQPKVYLFDRIIELMLSDATMSLKDIAAEMGRSAVWVGYVVKSDAFRDLYEIRRREHNAAVHAEVAESLARVAKKSLATLEKTIDNNPAKVTPQMAIDIASMSLEKLGYGVKLPGAPVTNVNVMSVSAEDFQRAQSIVRSVEPSSVRAEGSALAPRAVIAPPAGPLPSTDHTPSTAPAPLYPRGVFPVRPAPPEPSLDSILAKIDLEDSDEVGMAGDAA